jgi:hypothetical protein
MRCAAITKAGECCRLVATHGSYCYSHSPQTGEKRKRSASKGGKAGGNGRPAKLAGAGELATIRAELARLYASVMSGKADTGTASVAVQVQHARLRGVQTVEKAD